MISLVEPMKYEGNIENWPKKLEEIMQNTMRDILRNAYRDCMQLKFGDFE